MKQPWTDILREIKWAWFGMLEKLPRQRTALYVTRTYDNMRYAWGVGLLTEYVWRLGLLIVGLNGVGWGIYALIVLADKAGV